MRNINNAPFDSDRSWIDNNDTFSDNDLFQSYLSQFEVKVFSLPPMPHLDGAWNLTPIFRASEHSSPRILSPNINGYKSNPFSLPSSIHQNASPQHGGSGYYTYRDCTLHFILTQTL